MVIGIDASRAFVSEKTGTENYSYHLITEMLRLPESRRQTFVLLIRPNAKVPRELVGYDNVIVKTIKWKYLWTQAGLAWETWNTIMIHESRFKIQVLWVPAHTLPVLRDPRIKTVVTIHGLEYQWLPEYKNWLQSWYLPLSTMYAARYANRLIAVSQFTALQLEKELHTNRKKIKVVWEGVETRQHVSTSARDHVRTSKRVDGKYILFVGTIQPRKNLVSLIAAFSRLDPGLSQYKLVIAGGVGWMAEEVFGSAAQSAISERIIFTGRVSQAELEQLYGGAALYVQPSITEGFGLPVLEAMSYGVPVISSDGGALPEIIGQAGIVVKLGKNFVSELGRVMKRVISDKKLQKNLITKGYKRANEFTWQKTARQTLEVLVG